MTEQIPRSVFVQTVRRMHSPRMSLHGMDDEFITVVERKLFGVTKQ